MPGIHYLPQCTTSMFWLRQQAVTSLMIGKPRCQCVVVYWCFITLLWLIFWIIIWILNLNCQPKRLVVNMFAFFLSSWKFTFTAKDKKKFPDLSASLRVNTFWNKEFSSNSLFTHFLFGDSVIWHHHLIFLDHFIYAKIVFGWWFLPPSSFMWSSEMWIHSFI